MKLSRKIKNKMKRTKKQKIGKMRRGKNEKLSYLNAKYITKKKIGSSIINEVLSKADEKQGACIVFFGIVRADEINGKKVKEIFYDCYVEMAEKEIRKIEDEAKEKFGIKEAVIKHRIGKVKVNDVSLFVGVVSPHRKEGFSAIQYIIDEIKERVPIWKKEILEGGKEWRWKEEDDDRHNR